jgi:transcriptional regulator with XRE-family HTH domain
MSATTVGQRLRNARLQRRLTQQELASEVGCDNAQISRWENDVYVPSTESLRDLAATLGVSVDFLLGG